MSIFGPRIIGKAKFDAQKKAEKTGANIYGPKVTGLKSAPAEETPERPNPDRRRFAALEAEIAQLRAKLAAATDDDPKAADEQGPEGEGEDAAAPEATPELEGEDEEPGHLSKAEVADALEKNPLFLDRLIEQELGRSKGPRKGVSRILLEHEQRREGGAREAVVAQLEAVIGA